MLYEIIYEPDGTWLGAEPISDPGCIVQACLSRDAALFQAMSWRQYAESRPELKRHLAQ